MPATHLDHRAIMRAVTQRLLSQAASWPAGYVVVPPTWQWPDELLVAVRVERVTLETMPRARVEDDDVADLTVELALRVVEQENLDDAYTIAEAAGHAMKALRGYAALVTTGQTIHLDEATFEPAETDESTLVTAGTLTVRGNARRTGAETLES